MSIFCSFFLLKNYFPNDNNNYWAQKKKSRQHIELQMQKKKKCCVYSIKMNIIRFLNLICFTSLQIPFDININRNNVRSLIKRYAVCNTKVEKKHNNLLNATYRLQSEVPNHINVWDSLFLFAIQSFWKVVSLFIFCALSQLHSIVSLLSCLIKPLLIYTDRSMST